MGGWMRRIASLCKFQLVKQDLILSHDLQELEREFDRIKRDLAFSKDELSRVQRELSGKMGLEDDIRVLKQRNFDQELKMGEMKSYNQHMQKFNDLLKRNEEELKRKLKAYDVALSKNMNRPINLNTSPARRQFMAEYLVPDISHTLANDKTQAYEEIRKHYSRSLDHSPQKVRIQEHPSKGLIDAPYAQGKNYLFDKYLDNKYGAYGDKKNDVDFHRYKKMSNPNLSKNFILPLI